MFGVLSGDSDGIAMIAARLSANLSHANDSALRYYYGDEIIDAMERTAQPRCYVPVIQGRALNSTVRGFKLDRTDAQVVRCQSRALLNELARYDIELLLPSELHCAGNVSDDFRSDDINWYDAKPPKIPSDDVVWVRSTTDCYPLRRYPKSRVRIAAQMVWFKFARLAGFFAIPAGFADKPYAVRSSKA